MTEQVNLDEIKLKLIENLQPSGWSHKLRGFIQCSDFDKILAELYRLREDGKRFTPPLKQVFRAFQECPYDKLKVVIIGQDSYPQFGVADGMAFSCGNTRIVQPSLREIFKEVEKTVYQEWPTHQDPDLKRWANQGVLLLNTALTCQVDKPGSHTPIWHDFVMYLIDMITFTNTGLVFVLMGKHAHELESLINENHHVIKVAHPASASYNKTDWDSKDLFNECNRFIGMMNGPEYAITW